MTSNSKKKFRAVKYDGDDMYSWAIFKTVDIKGLRSPISGLSKIKPIISGLDRRDAQMRRDELESKYK